MAIDPSTVPGRALPALLALLIGCGASVPPRAAPPPTVPAPTVVEAPPAKALFTAPALASLFSYPGTLTVSDAALGAAWKENGSVVWSLSFASSDGSFAPVTMILFEGRYRGMSASKYERDVLRGAGSYHDLDLGAGRAGYAMRAGGSDGVVETASIPSPGGRFELILVIEIPKGGPKAAKGTEAYRSLLVDYPVRLIEAVAKGIDATWVGARPE